MELKDIIKEAQIVSEGTPFRKVLEKMIKSQTNSLLVVNEDGELTGEVSVADLFEGMVPPTLDGDDAMVLLHSDSGFAKTIKEAEHIPVEDFMSMDFDTVTPTDGLEAVAAIAIGRQQSRIPVVDHADRPVGVISRQGLKHILGSYLGIKDN